jgi:ATP synthase protein I
VSRRKHQLRQAGSWLDLSIVGIQFPVAIAIGFFWGRWMDHHLGTWPWLTAIFTLFGIVAGFVNLFRITAKAERDEAERARHDDAGEVEDGEK